MAFWHDVPPVTGGWLFLPQKGSLDAQFEKRPYQPPEVPQLIKEIEHGTHLAKARIVQYSDGVYAAQLHIGLPSRV